MWEALGAALGGAHARDFLVAAVAIVSLALVASKAGLLRIHTRHVSMGAGDMERTVLREQIDWTHTYVMGLEGKIRAVTPEMLHGGYFTKYILEVVFDEMVKWITFNHITADEKYIKVKQDKVSALVYMHNVQKEFTTPEFKGRMDNWVREIIEKLVEIRRLYGR